LSEFQEKGKNVVNAVFRRGSVPALMIGAENLRSGTSIAYDSGTPTNALEDDSQRQLTGDCLQPDPFCTQLL
jgi:hypothetical protein